MNLIICTMFLFSLTACAGALPWNKQNYAGINEITFSWCKADNGNEYLPCDVRIINGKENGAIDFKFETSDGSILNFAADDVKAFEGQNIRAKLEGLIAEKGFEIAPDIMDVIINAMGGI